MLAAALALSGCTVITGPCERIVTVSTSCEVDGKAIVIFPGH